MRGIEIAPHCLPAHGDETRIQHELSEFYGSLCGEPRPSADAYHAFRDFVLANADTLIPLLETRITHTARSDEKLEAPGQPGDLL